MAPAVDSGGGGGTGDDVAAWFTLLQRSLTTASSCFVSVSMATTSSTGDVTVSPQQPTTLSMTLDGSKYGKE